MVAINKDKEAALTEGFTLDDLNEAVALTTVLRNRRHREFANHG